MVPVPGRKKFGPRSRRKKNSGPGEKKILVPVAVPAKKSFRSWSRARQKQSLGEGSSQKYFCYGLGPKKTFWSLSCSEKILVLVLVKKNFGPSSGQKKILVPVPSRSRSKKKFGRGPGGTGTTLLISRHTSCYDSINRYVDKSYSPSKLLIYFQ